MTFWLLNPMLSLCCQYINYTNLLCNNNKLVYVYNKKNINIQMKEIKSTYRNRTKSIHNN